MALPKSRGDREYQKFIENLAGDVAVRTVLTDASGTDITLADDNAFTPGTSLVTPIGALVDDTATDSVDEGDIGAPRMSTDRLLYVQGALAHDAVDSGNPIKTGGRARTSQITAVANDDRTDNVLNEYGEQVNAGYTWGTDSNRTEEIDPVSSHHVEETLIDETNITTNTTTYAYLDLDGYRYFSLQGETSGTSPTDTLTVTIEATDQDDGTAQADCTYQDVTSDLFGVASWVDTDFFAVCDIPVSYKYIRVKYVTSNDSGDDADLTVYSKKLW